MKPLVRCLAFALVLGAAPWCAPLSAQDIEPEGETGPAASGAASGENIDARRKELAQRVLVAQRTLDSIPKERANESERSERLAREVDLLKQLDALYAQRQSADEAGKELQAGRSELDGEITDLRRNGPPDKPPYSFLLLDSLRDKLATAQGRALAVEEAVAAATEELDRAKQANDERQAERRRLKEGAERSRDPAAPAESAGALKLAELEASVAQQSLQLRQAELDNVKRSQAIGQVQLTLLEETLRWIEKDVVFSKNDLDGELAEIKKQETDLQQEIEAGECALTSLQEQWDAARRKLSATTNPDAALAEEENAAKLARYAQTKRIAAARKQLEFLGPLRQAWRCRFALATGNYQRGELATWSKETARAMEQLAFERRVAELLISESRKEMADLSERLDGVDEENPPLAHWISKEQETYNEIAAVQSAHLVKLDGQNNVYEKLAAEIAQKHKTQSLWDSLAAATDSAESVWNYEVANFGESFITIGKLVKCIVLLFVGVLVSRRLSAVFAKRVLSRFGIEGGAAVAFQSLAFYLLVVGWVLAALHTVHVPLTIFTFMGGAVAIGVGFGSQKILNNFISGVILLVEQPIRVGDVVDLGALSGTVEAIGTRSTRLRTGANSEIIVPNSSFLENNVVNWTLGDSTIRCSIKVGVAHGTITREAARRLKQVADDHGLVLKKPEPFVMFSDFGESALVFELYFWVDIRKLGSRRSIESDLRFMIDESFREGGITLAFPQRDMHLDTARPLEVRVVKPEASSGYDAEGGRQAA